MTISYMPPTLFSPLPQNSSCLLSSALQHALALPSSFLYVTGSSVSLKSGPAVQPSKPLPPFPLSGVHHLVARRPSSAIKPISGAKLYLQPVLLKWTTSSPAEFLKISLSVFCPLLEIHTGPHIVLKMFSLLENSELDPKHFAGKPSRK